MKRYLVFAGEDYYPAGGWGDFIEAFASHEDAASKAAECEERGDWSQVVDLERMEEVYKEQPDGGLHDEVDTKWHINPVMPYVRFLEAG